MRHGALLLLCCVLSVRANDPEFPGENLSLEKRLAELAHQEAEARKGQAALWPDILEAYRTLLNAHGDELAPVSKRHAVQVRRLCAARLARLPAEVLKQYRERLEPTAAKWLDEGRRLRDRRLLQRIVDEAFCAEAAAPALELLGDLAYERGDLDEALAWWRLLAVLPNDKPDELSLLYPAGTQQQAAALARQLLVRWIGGAYTRPDNWRRDLKWFRQRHADAEGHLAGQRGLFWQRLEAVAAQSEEDAGISFRRSWSTFAGDPTRNRLVRTAALTPSYLGELCRAGPSWRVPLAERNDELRPIQTPSDAARSLAFCPIVLRDRVLLADGRFVLAFDHKSGRREVWFDVHRLNENLATLKLPAPADVRFTLTAVEDCVLARLGDRDGMKYLVCLERDPSNKGDRLRWHAAADAKAQAHFEGSPLVHDGRAYIAVTRFEGGRSITALHCYALQARGLAALVWQRDVCQTRKLTPEDGKVRPQLLTLAGPLVVCCSHLGAVVAVDALTGRTAWAVRYSRDETARLLGPRDVNPCVFADGRLYVAPADTDVLFCLDPATGRQLWERAGIEVVHLLGVGRERVVFTTRTPYPGLRAVMAATGDDEGGWFRSAPAGPLHSFGRGLLTEDLVLWPTLKGVYCLRLEDGEQPDDPTLTHRLPSGNLAFAHGTLVVTDLDQLHVFTPTSSRK